MDSSGAGIYTLGIFFFFRKRVNYDLIKAIQYIKKENLDCKISNISNLQYLRISYEHKEL